MSASCEQCGTSYEQKRSDQMFCSHLCAARSWRGRKPLETKVCDCCNTKFTSKFRKKYCSDACIELANKKRLQARNSGLTKAWSKGKEFTPRRVCQNCGSMFYAPPVQMRRGGGKYCSNTCRTSVMAKNPAMFPQTKSRRGKGGKRADLGDIYFRSSWEANYARYLTWLKTARQIFNWEFEAQTFEFKAFKRGTRFYTPDFRITNNDGTIEYHEIKGYMDQRSQTKIDRFVKYFPNLKFVLIDRAAYQSIEKQMANVLPNWEARR